VEAGKLDLDAPIQQYCPQYPKKQWTITTRQLLSHLSGVRHYHGANGEPRKTDAERRALDELSAREDMTQLVRYTDVIKPLDVFKDDPLVFQPGTRFTYSSLGYRLLGCVLEGAAQTPYRRLMRELVFTPSRMSSITEDDALAIIPHRVSGYSRDDDDGTLHRARYRDVSSNLPAGGHLATPEDLVRFAVAFNSGKLVQESTRARMIERPKLLDGTNAPDVPRFFGLDAGVYYGMGVFVGSMNGEPLVMHTGSQSGTSTELLLAPDSGIAVAVMANRNGWNGAHALAKKIVESVTARESAGTP
jgi:serine beta-lactamase-like protein LACTB